MPTALGAGSAPLAGAARRDASPGPAAALLGGGAAAGEICVAFVPPGDQADALREIANLLDHLASPRAIGWLVLQGEGRQRPLQIVRSLVLGQRGSAFRIGRCVWRTGARNRGRAGGRREQRGGQPSGPHRAPPPTSAS